MDELDEKEPQKLLYNTVEEEFLRKVSANLLIAIARYCTHGSVKILSSDFIGILGRGLEDAGYSTLSKRDMFELVARLQLL